MRCLRIWVSFPNLSRLSTKRTPTCDRRSSKPMLSLRWRYVTSVDEKGFEFSASLLRTMRKNS